MVLASVSRNRGPPPSVFCSAGLTAGRRWCVVCGMAATVRRCNKLEKARRVRERLANCDNLLVVMQDYPDPDAIAAAIGIRELARQSNEVVTRLACGGFVGRAENQELVRYLGTNVLNLAAVNLNDFDCVVMVDTQPGTGNNTFPEGLLPDIVIDHHPVRNLTRRVPVYDVRGRYGATSTIVYEYLKQANVPLSVPLATALVYGIRSDTNDLGREATKADIAAFLSLYPMANKRMLGRIGAARVPRDYFDAMHTALEHARSHGVCLVSELGAVRNPDMVAELSDLLLRDEETTWALCCGVYEGRLLLSLRTSDQKADAGSVMHRVVGRNGTGGGHNMMAGGQIRISGGAGDDAESVTHGAVTRLLRILKVADEPERRLIPAPG
jgi:nanoRNase/pAp phosphatase (c-di-AMP/oligoRNAs hydrolase)